MAGFQYKKFSSYVNFSRFFRYYEYSIDPTVSRHPNEVTSSPATSANFGFTYSFSRVLFSTNLNYRGASHRKNSSMGEIEPLTGYLLDNPYSDSYSYPMYRPKVVPAWTNVNVRMMYLLSEKFQIGGYVSNLLNSSQYLLEVSNIPSDYRRERRRFFFEFKGQL
ncbi:MAG: TonB-dependent receptor [Leptospiraceae bacterium]|nr:TonB-dependent receptor [Leptospiraceae bacterium]MCP5500264.1 TonB-dependent receptor [Leptospiraceae bacterium]